MIHDPISVDRIIEILNEINKLDPTVLPVLMTFRVPCNKALADHPSVQVGEQALNSMAYEVGLLGILNGIVGAYDDGPRKGYGIIAANSKKDLTTGEVDYTHITHFSRLRNEDGKS